MYTQTRRPGRNSSSARGRNTFSSSRPHRGGNRSGGHRGGRPQLATFDVSRFINRAPARVEPEAPYVSTNRFEDFHLDQGLLKNIAAAGLLAPSPIQDQIIPFITEGRDVVGLANTGTGKTAAFLIPLLQKTLHEKGRQTLVLTPTRELAIQIEQELKKLSRGMRIFSTVCVGGANIGPQLRGLRQHNDFIIGTPGRILDLIERRAFLPAHVTTVVLDEADRMLDMGFIAPIRQILSGVPAKREMLFFSATLSPSIEGLVNSFLKNPATVSVKKKDITDNIEQDVIRCGGKDKFETLAELLARPEFSRVIVFGAMKHAVEKLSKQLVARGISAESIHGNKSHGQRQRALTSFKSGQAKVLVATDVAARGIHVDKVSHVINYDLPNTYEDYVHRIGRTGRGEHMGKALTFVS